LTYNIGDFLHKSAQLRLDALFVTLCISLSGSLSIVFLGFTLRPAGIHTIIADKVFMLWRDVLGELHYKITRLEQFYVRLPIFIVLKI
jgi:hypothetical protein